MKKEKRINDLNKLIKFYEGQKEINMDVKPEIIINDLKNLK